MDMSKVVLAFNKAKRRRWQEATSVDVLGPRDELQGVVKGLEEARQILLGFISADRIKRGRVNWKSK